MSQLDAIVALLHDRDVRAVLRRIYVDDMDPTLQLCSCADSLLDDAEGGFVLSARVLRRFHAWMERAHSLVVGSGSHVSNPTALRRTRGHMKEADSDAAGSGTSSSLEPLRFSTVFGSVTAAPLARLLAFLSSQSVPPSLRLCVRSRFLDIGSGIGQVVLHVQLRYALSSCVGVECV
jgi:hypothetical protein